jgi:hypothetical protein
MAKLKVEKTTSLNAEETYQKVKNFIQNDEGLRKLDQHYKCEFDDAGKICHAKGNQFTAQLSIKPEALGSKVEVEVEIPFALSLFKGKIQEMLQHKLDKTLG